MAIKKDLSIVILFFVSLWLLESFEDICWGSSNKTDRSRSSGGLSAKRLPANSLPEASSSAKPGEKNLPGKILPGKNLPGKNLKDAFLAALTVSETVNIQKELFLQSDETHVQAKGALFPTLSGAATTFRQATPTSATGTLVSPSEQDTVKISLSQPLFVGLRDFAALRQSKDLKRANYFALLNAAKQLFYDVSTAYFNVLAFEQDEKIT
jgi:outer membrane protein TolC